jgi:hypothetical protein
MASDQSENQLVAAGGGGGAGSIEPKDLRYAFGDFSFIDTIKEKDDIPHFKEMIYVILKEVFQAINNNNAWIEMAKNMTSDTTWVWDELFSENPSRHFVPTQMMIKVKNDISSKDIDPRIMIWVMHNMWQILRDGWDAYIFKQISDIEEDYYESKKKFGHTFILRDGPPFIPRHVYGIGDFSFLSSLYNPNSDFHHHGFIFNAINLNDAWREMADENLGRINPKEDFSDDCNFVVHSSFHDLYFRRKIIYNPKFKSAYDEITYDSIGKICNKSSVYTMVTNFDSKYKATPLIAKLLGKNDQDIIDYGILEILYQMKIIANLGWNAYVDMMTKGTAVGSAEGLAPKVP